MKITNLKEMANTIMYMEKHDIDSEPSAFVPLNKLKSVRAKLIDQQKKLRPRYYSAKNEEKCLYAIKRNVDNMLGEPSLENQRKRSRDTPL